MLDRPTPWRVASGAVLLLAALLAVVSFNSSAGTDLRPGRYGDLEGLVQRESGKVQRQQAEVADLETRVQRLSKAVVDDSVREAQTRADSVGIAAGFSEVSGPAVTITLSDAPADLAQAAPADRANDYVVHQQDIQAVVNALWAGGAKAVTVQGQRIISTTGIKCEGSMVTLHGVPYPQPNVISAVGDLATLLTSIELNQRVAAFRADAANPAIAIGWDLATQAEATAPAYSAPVSLAFAKEVGH